MSIRICLMATFLAFALPAFAAGAVPDDVSAALEQAGVAVYPGAEYCIGNPQIGIRFASSDDPETVKAWYVEHVPAWNVKDVFGMWILIDAPADAKISGSDLMTRNNIVVDVNPELPGWHGLAGDMTTQIVVSLPH